MSRAISRSLRILATRLTRPLATAPLRAPVIAASIPSSSLVRSFHCSHPARGGHAVDYNTPTSDFLDPHEVETRVLAVLKNIDKLAGLTIGLDSTFAELGLDSLDAVEVVMQLEDEFCVDLFDPDAAKIVSVRDAVNVFSNFPFAQ